MSGFIFVPIVRVGNVGFLAIVQNVVCTNCRGAEAWVIKFEHQNPKSQIVIFHLLSQLKSG